MCDCSNNDENVVILIADNFAPRVVKIAYALQKSNKKVVLLYKHNHLVPLLLDKLSKYCVKVQVYKDKEEALKLAKQYKPLVYHIFCCYNYDVAAFFINNNLSRIVVDPYDLINGFLCQDLIDKQYSRSSILEKFCLENADGICCRSMETQYQKKFLNYKFKSKRIYFLDYCWNNPIQEPVKTNDKELHIVYVGGFTREKDQPNHPWSYNLWLANLLANQKIHYHIYPSYDMTKNDFEEKFSDYIELEKQTPYFHFNETIDNDLLIQELMQYDYGILILSKNINGIEDGGHHKQAKYKYCTSNKIFDYLDAGLPVIINQEKYMKWLINRYEIGINANIELLTSGKKTLKQNLLFLSKNVNISREKLSINKHIPRLIKFYKDL